MAKKTIQVISDGERGRAGIFYGIGVGPGDPELLTLKAVRVMEECDVLAVPGKDVKDSIAYQIAIRAVPKLENKSWFSVPMPMTRDDKCLRESHEQAADQMIEYLKSGQDVGFVNLGDVAVYATFLYLHDLILKKGFSTRLVNGVPSFCAAASALNAGLVLGKEQLHLLSSPEQLEEGLKLPGTKVIMKPGKSFEKVKHQILDSGYDAMVVENCGLPGEKICRSLRDWDGAAGYYCLLIVKD